MFRSGIQGEGLQRRRLLQSGAAAVPAALVAMRPVTAAAETTRPGADDMVGGHRAGGRKTPVPITTTTADWAAVAEAFGRPGSLMRGLYYHTPFPRWDLRVVSQGVRVTPELAVGSHAAFTAYSDGEFLLMGDMVVPEHRLQGFLDDLTAAGIMVTAVHKHLLAQRPALWWVHTCAVGAHPSVLAAGLKRALDRAGTPPPPAPSKPVKLELDTAGIDAALGARGTGYGPIYTTAFLRREAVHESGRLLPRGLAATTAINFQPLGGGRAAVSGDFAMTAREVQDALAALRRGGVRIVSLHNHGLDDQPRLFFTHFWAVDDAVRIARAVREAVVLTNVGPALP